MQSVAERSLRPAPSVDEALECKLTRFDASATKFFNCKSNLLIKFNLLSGDGNKKRFLNTQEAAVTSQRDIAGM